MTAAKRPRRSEPDETLDPDEMTRANDADTGLHLTQELPVTVADKDNIEAIKMRIEQHHLPVLSKAGRDCQRCGAQTVTIDWQELGDYTSHFHLTEVEHLLPIEKQALISRDSHLARVLEEHRALGGPVSYSALHVVDYTVSKPVNPLPAPGEPDEVGPVAPKFSDWEIERLIRIAAEAVHGKRENLSENDRFLVARAFLLLRTDPGDTKAET